MVDGTTYYMASVAADRVIDEGNNPDPNYEVNRTTITFWWDTVEPESRVDAPLDGKRYSSLTEIRIRSDWIL